MATITINVSDSATSVIRDMNSKIAELPSKTEELISRISSTIESDAKQEAPVLFGDLQNSINTENVGLLERLITPHVDYAVYVHEGYGPFELNSPVNIKGGWVYIKTHPGYTGNPFMNRAAEQGESYAEQLSDEFLEWLVE